MVREGKRGLRMLRRILGGFSLLSASHLQVPGRWWCVLGRGRAGNLNLYPSLAYSVRFSFSKPPFRGRRPCGFRALLGNTWNSPEAALRIEDDVQCEMGPKRRCPPTPPPHGRRALHFRRPDASCAIPPRVAHGRPPSALPVSGSAAAGFDRSSRILSQTGTPPRCGLGHLFRVQLLFENVHVVDRCVFFSPPGTRLFDIPPGPSWDGMVV